MLGRDLSVELTDLFRYYDGEQSEDDHPVNFSGGDNGGRPPGSSEDSFEISGLFVDELKQYSGERFFECEAYLADHAGVKIRSIARMTFLDALVLSELPSKNSPVPFSILFDDVAVSRANGIRGGLVNIHDGMPQRSSLAEDARYTIRGNYDPTPARVSKGVSQINGTAGKPVMLYSTPPCGGYACEATKVTVRR